MIISREWGIIETNIVGDQTMKNNPTTDAPDRYTEEAKRRWGGTEAWKEYESKTARTSPEEREDALKGLTDIFTRIGELKDRSPRDPEVRAQIAGLQEYITRHFYNCTDEIFSGLGKMYSADWRFKENIDKAGGPGTAEFVSEAIEVYYQEKNG